jgi:mono/diheme cytochrome c family protein
MLNPFLVLSAMIVFAFTPALNPGRMPLNAALAQAPTASAPKSPAKITPETQAKAKKLYAVDCAMCHGDNGNGKTDMASSMGLTLGDWSDSKNLSAKADQELFDAIRKGKDKMPPEAEARATNDEVWNLIHYIRGFSKGQPTAAAAHAN